MSRHNRRSVPAFLKGPGRTADQPVLLERPVTEGLPPLVTSVKGLVEVVLGPRLRALASDHGGYSYDPCGLFLVLLFGYLQGIRSSRRLEEACKFDRRYEYLSDGVQPDHATLARLRRRAGCEIEDLFLLVCQEAERRGVLERRAMVVDGTKVAAVRNQWKRALKEAEEVDALEDEAQTMLSNGKYLVGYNLQVAADASSGMIVGYVASSCATDRNLMGQVADSVERQSGGLPQKAVADRGYDSGQNAQALTDKGVEAVLPAIKPRQAPFTKDDQGRVVCPAGHVAKTYYYNERKTGLRLRYRVTGCAQCPLRVACGATGRRRELTVTASAPTQARLQANARCETEEGRTLLRLRGPTIERVFGQFKGNQGFRRLLLRGLSGATVELGLLALGFNLRALI